MLTPKDVLAVGLGQFPDAVIEAPPRWQRVRVWLKDPEHWDPELLSERRFQPQCWQRPVLRAVGLKREDNIRPLPSRTLHELSSGDILHDPIPPWIIPEDQPTTTDWLPLSQAQRTELDLLFGKYQRRRIRRLRRHSCWREEVFEYLTATHKFAQDSEQVIEGLLSHLMVRIGCSRQDIINALPRRFFDPIDVDGEDGQEESDLEEEMSDILYAHGPIYLNMPAADSQDLKAAHENTRSFYHRRGLESPDDKRLS